MDYQSIHIWLKTLNIIKNRVQVINQMLGVRYRGMVGSPCVLRLKNGLYTMYWCGEEFCSWRLYVQSEIESALVRVDALNDCVWLANRSGYLQIVN